MKYLSALEEQLEFRIVRQLTLLTNIVMAFNTRWMQQLVDVDPEFNEPEMLRYIAPTAFEHINFKGVFAFGVERYRESLLGLAPAAEARSGAKS